MFALPIGTMDCNRKGFKVRRACKRMKIKKRQDGSHGFGLSILMWLQDYKVKEK